MSTIWMMVTNDKYELPLAVADSRSELARLVGIKVNGIQKAMQRERQGKEVKSEHRFRKVEVE